MWARVRAGWLGHHGVLAAVIALMVVLAAVVGYVAPLGGDLGIPEGAASLLRWQVVNPPTGQKNPFQVEVSPADGHIAWTCEPRASGGFAIWRTADAGVTWRQVATVQSHARGESSTVGCQLHADQDGTSDLALNTFEDDSTPGTGAPQVISYLSTNGGTTWHTLPGHTVIFTLASKGENLFVMLALPNAVGYGAAHLVVSTDDLKTWRYVVAPGATTSPAIGQVFSAPGADGMILMGQSHAFHISNDGKTWTPVLLPDGASDHASDLQLVTWRGASHQWMICDTSTKGASAIQCTTDDGRTWNARPLLPNLWMCPNCRGTPIAAVSGGLCLPNALGRDGSLFGVCWPKLDITAPDGEPGSAADPAHLYRLAPGATSWVDLGVMGGGEGEPRVYGQVVWDIGAPATWVANLATLPT